MNMKTKTVLKALSDLLINLSATWFAVMFISPGLTGIKSATELTLLLTANLPFGILSLIIGMQLAEEANEY